MRLLRKVLLKTKILNKDKNKNIQNSPEANAKIKFLLPQKEFNHLVKSDFVVIAYKVIPNTTAAVATAESSTVAGSYMPHILDTKYDYAMVKVPSSTILLG